MRGAFKRSTALKRCTRALSEVCTRTLHGPLGSCRLRRTTQRRCLHASTPRGPGLSPCTERHSAGHAKQRAAWPRWPEEPLAQLSWASSDHAPPAQSHAGICDQACRSPEPLRRDAAARSSRGSAALLDKRLLSGEGRATTRLWSQMPVCDYWHLVARRL